MTLEDEFQRYFDAVGHGPDRCYLCRRTPAEVKRFFGFDEDGVPLEAEQHGLEDVVLEKMDIMSYRGERPVCAVCQLNMDAISTIGEFEVLRELSRQMREERDRLWPEPGSEPDPQDT
ncbi:MAG: hypothetical protein AAF726_20085 [Planctomycetota bacterium]